MMQNKTPRQQDLRKGRFSQNNQIYHITTNTLKRMPIFLSFDMARIMVSVLKQSDALNHTQTLAFVVMPDHIHWLFQLNLNQTLATLIQSVKSVSAHTLGQTIWQAGYYDHAIRKDEDIRGIARYIIANPVRAGLVKKVGDYPHWDAVWI
jgi:REP element-mobilizing transposase RayT